MMTTSKQRFFAALAVVAVLALGGCASAPKCELASEDAREIDGLLEDLALMSGDSAAAIRNDAPAMIQTEIRTLEAELEAMRYPSEDQCRGGSPNLDRLPALKQRVRAANEAMVIQCLRYLPDAEDSLDTARAGLDAASGNPEVNAWFEDYDAEKDKLQGSIRTLDLCLERAGEIDSLNQRAAGLTTSAVAAVPSSAPPTPATSRCDGAPVTLEQIRQADSAGDEGVLEDYRSAAEARVAELQTALDDLLNPAREITQTDIDTLALELDCAGEWILALGGAGAAPRELRNLRSRLDDAAAVRAMRTAAAELAALSDPSSPAISPSGIGRRWIELQGLFEAVLLPDGADRGWLQMAADGAVAALQRVGMTAVDACENEDLEGAVSGLNDLGKATEADGLQARFMESCGFEVGRLAEEIDRADAELTKAMSAGSLGLQDPVMGRYIAAAGQVDHLSPSARSLLGREVDLEQVNLRRSCVETMLAGDRALAGGDAIGATRAYNRAGDMAECRVDRARFAEVDLTAARGLETAGDYDGAWSRYNAAGDKGASVLGDLIRVAGAAAAVAPEDSRTRYNWLDRLWTRAGPSRMSPAQLMDLAATASVLAGDQSALWTQAWAAAEAAFDRPGFTPSITDFAVASRIAHRLDMESRAWVGDMGADSYLGRYQSWCDRYSAVVGPATTVRARSFTVYHELLAMAVDAIEAVEEQAADLDPERRAAIRDKVVPAFLDSIQDTPLIERAALSEPVTGSGDSMDELAGAARRKGMAVAADGAQMALADDTPWGRLVMVFAEVDAAGPAVGTAEVANRLAVARAEALGAMTGILVELTSDRSDLSVNERKERIHNLIEGLRWRMGHGVLAYAGLFNRDGMLEVPDSPALFFLDGGLRRTGTPVFQDPVSRRAAAATERTSQGYKLAGRDLADVAVPVMRGRNRLGVLRLGVIQIDITQE